MSAHVAILLSQRFRGGWGCLKSFLVPRVSTEKEKKKKKKKKKKIIIIMYIYHALINALSTHMIFYTHVLM